MQRSELPTQYHRLDDDGGRALRRLPPGPPLVVDSPRRFTMSNLVKALAVAAIVVVAYFVGVIVADVFFDPSVKSQTFFRAK